MSRTRRFQEEDLKEWSLEEIVEGVRLENHDDVPEGIRDPLYAEEQQDLERRRKRRATSPAVRPPIHITNVLPHQGPAGSPTESTRAPAEPGLPLLATCLEIAGPRDVAMEYQKACAMTLDEGLDLELVHEDEDADIYIRKGVKTGVARRFIRNIETWAKNHTI
ncbi:hypothetical protein GE09DRAFT_1204351 [Coniochaeta sp. 2T2.1]|nr:hypothetical protein GE09DRAFT_1204351 [Coniochaeta sp. 2T2.1]